MGQDTVLEFLKGQHLYLSGDGHCDSLGYSVKDYSYSIMDSASDLILDYNKVIQSSETWSSEEMDKEGLKTKSQLFTIETTATGL